jgi:hypothetical protein
MARKLLLDEFNGREDTLKGRLFTSAPAKTAPILKRGLPFKLTSEKARPLLCFCSGGKERDRSQTVTVKAPLFTSDSSCI